MVLVICGFNVNVINFVDYEVLFFIVFKLIFKFRFCLLVVELDFNKVVKVFGIVERLVVFLWLKFKFLKGGIEVGF